MKLSYSRQSIDRSDIKSVLEVLKGDWLTQGSAVELFEKDLKTYFGAKYCCAVSSGTASLHLAGIALGWQPGDIVITSPITFLASANCIIYAGATPDFADIDPVTYTIDPNQVEEKVKSHQSKGKNVKAIVGVDYAGHPCDWKALKGISEKYNLQLVNDNCHALGSEYFGDEKYAVKFADVVTQSYHPTKNFTTGEGGAVFTNDPEIDEKVRRLRAHGVTKDPVQLENSDGPWYYEMHEIGYNYRITDFQCALGSNQLKKLKKFVQKRREIAKKYDESFYSSNLFKIPEVKNSVVHARHLYPLQIYFDKLPITKTQLFEKMKQVSINLQVHYIPVHLQPFFQNKYGFKRGDFPVSEKFYSKEVSLPIYFDLSLVDQKKVIDKLSHFSNV